MTEPKDEAADADPPPPAAKAAPAWRPFLLPASILLGSLAIAAAILYVWRDGGSGEDGSAAAADGGTESTMAPAAGLLDTFVGYANEIGLDESEFQACVLSDAPADLMNDHLQRGIELGVSGTPTFFINNKMLVGSQPVAVLNEIIDAELAGSPDSLEGYSVAVQALASSGRFAIVPGAVDLAGAEFEGSEDAPVIIAEFSDFQCPFCGAGSKTASRQYANVLAKTSRSPFCTSRSSRSTRTPATLERSRIAPANRGSSGRCTTCSSRGRASGSSFADA